MTTINKIYTTDSLNKMKSRYCVKCEAVVKWQCNCPNNVRHKNIMEKFHKFSMIAVEQSLKHIGLEQTFNKGE